MKRISQAFIALAALALAFFVGGNVYLQTVCNSVALRGSVLYGSRDAAAGVSVTERMSLAGHLLWELSWDALSGEGEEDSHWSFAYDDLSDYVPTPSLTVSTGTSWRRFYRYDNYNYDYDGITGVAAYDAMIADLRAGREDEDYLTGVFTLNDYTDYYILRMDGACLRDANTDDRFWSDLNELTELFRIPLTSEIRLRVTYEYDGEQQTATIEAADEDAMPYSFEPEFESMGVYSPEGYFYFVFSARDAVTGELLPGDELPGGGWSVYRVPVTELRGYERYQNGDTSGWRSSDVDVASLPGRWWTENGYSASVDFTRLESVYSLGDNWQSARMCLSYDGGQILLFTVEDGVWQLTVLDAATGECVQRCALFPAGDTVDDEGYRIGSTLGAYSDGERAVFTYEHGGDAVAVPASIEGGRYVLSEAVELSSDAGSIQDCVWDGERLAVLWDTTLDKIGGGSENPFLLTVHESGELAYAELLCGKQRQGVWYRYFADTSSLSLAGYEMSELDGFYQ